MCRDIAVSNKLHKHNSNNQANFNNLKHTDTNLAKTEHWRWGPVIIYPSSTTFNW